MMQVNGKIKAKAVDDPVVKTAPKKYLEDQLWERNIATPRNDRTPHSETPEFVPPMSPDR